VHIGGEESGGKQRTRLFKRGKRTRKKKEIKAGVSIGGELKGMFTSDLGREKGGNTQGSSTPPPAVKAGRLQKKNLGNSKGVASKNRGK